MAVSLRGRVKHMIVASHILFDLVKMYLILGRKTY